MRAADAPRAEDREAPFPQRVTQPERERHLGTDDREGWARLPRPMR